MDALYDDDAAVRQGNVVDQAAARGRHKVEYREIRTACFNQLFKTGVDTWDIQRLYALEVVRTVGQQWDVYLVAVEIIQRDHNAPNADIPQRLLDLVRRGRLPGGGRPGQKDDLVGTNRAFDRICNRPDLAGIGALAFGHKPVRKLGGIAVDCTELHAVLFKYIHTVHKKQSPHPCAQA